MAAWPKRCQNIRVPKHYRKPVTVALSIESIALGDGIVGSEV
jgi:hypothetical protein